MHKFWCFWAEIYEAGPPRRSGPTLVRRLVRPKMVGSVMPSDLAAGVVRPVRVVRPWSEGPTLQASAQRFFMGRTGPTQPGRSDRADSRA